MTPQAEFALSVIKADIGSVGGHNRPHSVFLRRAAVIAGAPAEKAARWNH